MIFENIQDQKQIKKRVGEGRKKKRNKKQTSIVLKVLPMSCVKRKK